MDIDQTKDNGMHQVGDIVYSRFADTISTIVEVKTYTCVVRHRAVVKSPPSSLRGLTQFASCAECTFVTHLNKNWLINISEWYRVRRNHYESNINGYAFLIDVNDSLKYYQRTVTFSKFNSLQVSGEILDDSAGQSNLDTLRLKMSYVPNDDWHLIKPKLFSCI